MPKRKIPYGYVRDKKTGRLKKKRMTGKDHKMHGKGIASAAAVAGKAAIKYAPAIAKTLAPIIAGEVINQMVKAGKRQKKKKGSGLKLMGRK